MNAATTVLAQSYDPFTGIGPTLGPFQPIIGSKIGIFISVCWAIGFVYAAYHLLSGIARVSRAKSIGASDVLDDARRELGFAGASLIGLSALPVIFSVLTS